MDKKLQGNLRAHISQNGEGIEYGVERYHAEETHPSRKQEQAPLSSVNRRRSEQMKEEEGVLCLGDDGIGGGAEGRTAECVRQQHCRPYLPPVLLQRPRAAAPYERPPAGRPSKDAPTDRDAPPTVPSGSQ